MQKRIKKIATVVLVFFVSLMLTAAALVTVVCITLTNRNFYKEQLQRTAYSDGILENLNESLTSLGIPGGIPESVITDVVSVIDINSELDKQVDAMFLQKDYEVNTGAVYEEFRSEFVNYAKKQDIKTDKIVISGLEYLAEECSNLYSSNVAFPFFSQISSLGSAFNQYAPFVVFGLIAAAAAMCAAVWFMQRWKHRAVRYYIYSLIGSGASLFIFPVVILIAKPYNRLLLEPAASKSFVSSVAQTFFSELAFAGVFVMLIAAALIPLYRWARRKAG